MALTRNREINYRNQIEFIEHITGKKVLSWQHKPQYLGTHIYFTDKTMTFVEMGQMIEMERLVFEPLPRSICVSCGQDMHFGTTDWLGRCEHTIKHFWENARKVFWHRYQKLGKLPL